MVLLQEKEWQNPFMKISINKVHFHLVLLSVCALDCQGLSYTQYPYYPMDLLTKGQATLLSPLSSALF